MHSGLRHHFVLLLCSTLLGSMAQILPGPDGDFAEDVDAVHGALQGFGPMPADQEGTLLLGYQGIAAEPQHQHNNGASHGSDPQRRRTKSPAIETRGGAGPAAPKSDKYNARMQLMITRQMRKVLEEELNYAPEEVDDMEPQIAAVVIEKGLPRPRAGMPIAWRKSIQRSKQQPGSRVLGPIKGGIGSACRAVGGAVSCIVKAPVRLVKGMKGGAGSLGRVGKRGLKASKIVLPALALVGVGYYLSTAGEEAFWKGGNKPARKAPRSRGANIAGPAPASIPRGHSQVDRSVRERRPSPEVDRSSVAAPSEDFVEEIPDSEDDTEDLVVTKKSSSWLDSAIDKTLGKAFGEK